MNGQVSCEGPQGPTTLSHDAENVKGPGAFMRPLDELKGTVVPADVKEHMGYN
jgi:hypothetical protein